MELAKKCRDLAIKAHPYELPGAKAGNASAERGYFSECVSHNGKMPTATNTGSSPSATINPRFK